MRALLEGTYVAPLDPREPPPGARLWPSVGEIVDYLARVRSAALDIEWAGPHVVMVGLWGRGPYRELGGLTIRFRVDGRPNESWSYEEWRRVVRALYVWLADPGVTKSMQNGQSADVWMLERLGFVVNGYDFDTMLTMHVADPERTKGLEAMATALCELPHWKWTAKGESEGEGK